MKRFYFLELLVGILVMAGCENSNEYNPSKYITKENEREIINSIVRYAAKLPPNSTHTTKFDSTFNSYYRAVSVDYDIRSYFISKDSMHYMLITRAAKSITPMREAIGCKFQYSMDGSLRYYEEVFRTWKMPENVLNERYPVLFDKMVKGESLEPYYSKNKGDQYIEFPDDRFYFDAQTRTWNDKVFEPKNE